MATKKLDMRDRAFRGAVGRALGETGANKSSLAEKVNVSPKTPWNWLARPETISLGHFRILARELRLSDDEILRIVR